MKRLLTILLLAAGLTALSLQAQTLYVCRGADVETVSAVDFGQNGAVLNGTIDTSGIDSITTNVPRLRFVGGDISMLAKYEAQHAAYKTKDGQGIADLIAFLRQQGWNTLRVRLFVDPTQSSDQKQVVQDLDYVTALGRRIKQAGMLFMLDFHYSDTWADPANQWTPAAWAALTGDELATKVYEYTRHCLDHLAKAGAAPDFIQTGNEISYGMLWGPTGTSTYICTPDADEATWNRLTTLLHQAGRACREVVPRAQIVIHTERASDPATLTAFYDRMKAAAVDYDVIGLSYYSYYHGSLTTLDEALNAIEARAYGKPIQIVETGYPANWGAPGTTFDYSDTYPYTEAGQQLFVADLISLLKRHKTVSGLLWWYPEANACGATGDLKSGWYNVGLFNNSNGRALPALYDLGSFK